jgi:amino acid transporter
MVTSWQIAGISITFMRDKREKKLVPNAVSWWGWVTFASFFVVSAIPFVYTGPLAFDGIISFWFAFFTWFIWCPWLSYYIIKAVGRLKAEDEAAAAAGQQINT